MAREIEQIKKAMTDAFMADPVIRQRYGLSPGDNFQDSFSIVSLESILFGIFAAATYALESIFDIFSKEIDDKIATSIVATIPWYYQTCLDYQHGDPLELNPATFGYGYITVDRSKQVIKYAACRDRGGGVYILVAGAGPDGLPKALSNDVLTSFTNYMNLRKPAGVVTEIYSYDPDDIAISMAIQYNPIVVKPDGTLISDPSRYPAEEAVNSYLAGIKYGGTFNIHKLIDAIQQAEGVVDLSITSIRAKAATEATFTKVEGNSYTSVGGAFKAYNLRNNIRYVLEI